MQKDPTERAAGSKEAALGGRSNLSSEMQSVNAMIRDLEDQLDRMLETNDALKHDLEDERNRRINLEKNVHDLNESVRRSEQEVAAKDNLLAEIGHLNNERSRLTTGIRELEQRLAEAERDKAGQSSLIKRLQAAQSDTLEEVQSVESQFERAMQMLSQFRAQVAVLTEERDALGGRLRVAEDKLRQLQAERDVLSAEVEQSRGALDEIRRSLADACAASAEPVRDGGRG